MTPETQRRFGLDLTLLLNQYSAENDSNTPDYILSAYLIACLNAFNESIVARKRWYGGDTTQPHNLTAPEP